MRGDRGSEMRTYSIRNRQGRTLGTYNTLQAAKAEAAYMSTFLEAETLVVYDNAERAMIVTYYDGMEV